jgi:2-amino-4-hydroxy-6-hydroxymethyldihydropteridine diphosphokinase|tara:strand:- start:1156 stop:1665 length:510 start_codon:yes stop_codon:yes gene_type:complete
MIHLNIGSNLESNFGTKFKNVSIAINLLVEAKIKINKISNFYESPSYPNKKYPKFANIGVLVESKYNYLELFKKIKLIEKKMGRIKSKKNDPRVCDIDIIDFMSMSVKTKNLQLPHPRCHLRNFVLYPIKEIDSKWMHPILRKNVDLLINDLSQNSRIEITRLRKSVII